MSHGNGLYSKYGFLSPFQTQFTHTGLVTFGVTEVSKVKSKISEHLEDSGSVDLDGVSNIGPYFPAFKTLQRELLYS